MGRKNRRCLRARNIPFRDPDISGGTYSGNWQRLDPAIPAVDIKTSAPVIIENRIKESPFIEQALVIGENQKFASALLVPSFAFIQDYCKRKNIEYTGNEKIIKNPVIKARIAAEIEKVNADLAQYERIKRPELLAREWSIEKGEMTPKLSLKRKVILTTNQALVDKIYSAD